MRLWIGLSLLQALGKFSPTSDQQSGNKVTIAAKCPQSNLMLGSDKELAVPMAGTDDHGRIATSGGQKTTFLTICVDLRHPNCRCAGRVQVTILEEAIGFVLSFTSRNMGETQPP